MFKNRYKYNSELRDHFSGLAMQGTVRDYDCFDRCAEDAYRQADAMLVERNKHHKERHETVGEEL